MRGRMFVGRNDHNGLAAVNASGQVVYASNDDVRWLTRELDVDDSVEIDLGGDFHNWIEAVAVADDGGGAAYAWNGGITAIVGLDRDAGVRWTARFDSAARPTVELAIGPDHVFLVTDEALTFSGVTAHHAVIALDRKDGRLVWSHPLGEPADGASPALVAEPNGGAVVAATRREVGAPTQRGAIVALDGQGAPRWTVELDAPMAKLTQIARAPDGRIAVSGSWQGGAARFADQTFSAERGAVIATLEPDGRLAWVNTSESPGSARATDGTTVWTAGSVPGDDRDPDTVVSAFDATGRLWQWTAGGPGNQHGRVAFGGDTLFAFIQSYTDDFTSARGDASFTLGDVTVTGNGLAIVELAR